MKRTLTAFALLLSAAGPLAAQTGTPAPTAIQFVSEQTAGEVLGTDFVGRNVHTKDGQKVGDVNNLVFDAQGRIDLIVIGVGGFLGLGQKEVAVPFENVTFERKENRDVLVVDTTKEQLQAAPAYKTLNDQAFNQRVNEWRGKAAQAWNEVSDQAKKAYEDARKSASDAASRVTDGQSQQQPPARAN